VGSAIPPVERPHCDNCMNQPRYSRWIYTTAGLGAILFWSVTIGVSRSLAVKIGALPAGAYMWLAGGALACLFGGLVWRNFGQLFRLPRPYLLGCGACFVAYMVCLYLAIGWAENGQQIVAVGILNYLWPSLTLVFSIPILGVRFRPIFWLGVALALAGAVLAPLHAETYSLGTLLEGLRGNPWPYALAAAAGVLWALYSVLSQKWGGAAETGGVPLFAVAAGLVLGAMALAMPAPKPAEWSLGAGAELAFMAVFTVALAYSLWDVAMRRGNATLAAAGSCVIPALSTVATCMYLGVMPGPMLWVASGLVVGGAVLCHLGVRTDPQGAK
jgi:drug/metabolite transporter (DMT)-like permease